MQVYTPIPIEETDKNIIPEYVYQEVINRDYNGLIYKLKRRIPLIKKLTNFYYEIMLVNYQNYSKIKAGSCDRTPWIAHKQIESGKPYIIPYNQQVRLVQYVYQQERNGLQTKSNFGFLMFSLGKYLQALQRAWNTYNQKSVDLQCFFYLGIDVKNNQELYQWLLKFVLPIH